MLIRAWCILRATHHKPSLHRQLFSLMILLQTLSRCD